MRLSTRIAHANMPAPVGQVFVKSLRMLADVGGSSSPEQSMLIDCLLPIDLSRKSSDFDALEPYRALFLEACIYVAVADGEYCIDEARLISKFAHQLGLSVRRLAQLEARTFLALRNKAMKNPKARPRNIAILWDSDAEVVTTNTLAMNRDTVITKEVTPLD